MKIKKITGEDCKAARSLWEEVFCEDSVEFTDYYFQQKADKNIGYVIGQEPYDAMMFRTPYHLHMKKEQRIISYIVGVATRKECRHRGYMRNLLLHSFQEMYEEKQPFTFLMPANPDIYEPFDFRYIYERDVWKLKEGVRIEDWLETGKLTQHCVWNGLYRVSEVQKQFPNIPILDMLAEFANEYLKKHYHVYVHRDEEYYEMQMKESRAQKGDIYAVFEQGEITAFFLYAKEGNEVFIQEVIEAEEGILHFLQKEEKKKPVIMARIIHLEEMMKLVCSKEYRKFTIKIEDDLIPRNAGIYDWEITPNGSRVIRLQQSADGELKAAQINEPGEKKVPLKQENEARISMHICDLAEQILTGVFINEIV